MKKWSTITFISTIVMVGCSSKEFIAYEKKQTPAADHREYIYGVTTVEQGERKHLGAAFDMDHKEHVVGYELKQAIPKEVVIKTVEFISTPHSTKINEPIVEIKNVTPAEPIMSKPKKEVILLTQNEIITPIEKEIVVKEEPVVSNEPTVNYYDKAYEKIKKMNDAAEKNKAKLKNIYEK